MRISLGDSKSRQQARPKRRLRRRGSRTFHTAVVQAWPQARRRPLRQAAPVRQSRAEAQRAVQPAVVTPPRLPALFVRKTILAHWWSWLILGALIGGIVFVSTDARFFVYDAQITGVRHLDGRAIYEASGVHEQNIFWIQPHVVAERIAQIVGVKAVRVRCGLPAKVVIDVEEREPLVVWRSDSQGRDWWLDKEGVALPYGGDPKSDRTVFVLDLSPNALQAGERLRPDGIVTSVQQLAAALPGTRLFYYDAEHGLSFMQQGSGGNWPVYIGTSDDLPDKIGAAAVLRDYLGAHKILPSYVDIRWADWPLYGLNSGNGGGND